MYGLWAISNFTLFKNKSNAVLGTYIIISISSSYATYWIHHSSNKWKTAIYTEDEIWAAYEQGKIYVPPYHPFILIVTSPIIAYIITKYFEEPISNILKGKK